ncbi:unnamed protein product, partial [Rotaria magnacalcarata]
TSKDAETRPLTNLYSENNIIETAKKKSTSSKISKKKAKAEKKEADMDDLKKELDIVSISSSILPFTSCYSLSNSIIQHIYS